MVAGLMALEKQLAKQVGLGLDGLDGPDGGRVSRCPNGIFVSQIKHSQEQRLKMH